jgi:hypothetical protein
VENSGQVLGSIRPICAHFNAKMCWNPLHRRESGFIQEALFGRGERLRLGSGGRRWCQASDAVFEASGDV